MTDRASDQEKSSPSACYNSYEYQKGLSARERILKVIEESEIELTPKQIAQKAHVNHISTRVYLPQLVAENKILTPYHGTYCSLRTHGLRFSGVRVHNLVAVGGLAVDVHDEVVEVVGGVKVRVVFGVERQRVSMFVSCDAGMDRNGCLLALRRCFDIVKAKTGVELVDVELKTFELNRDYLGVRVDTPICITQTGLFDLVERVYQKDEGVRHEWKISKSMTLAEFSALLQGGVTSYNVTQSSFALIQEVRKLTDALKLVNDQLLTQGKVLEGVVQWIYRQNDKEKKKDG